jgi:hypothetical protein
MQFWWVWLISTAVFGLWAILGAGALLLNVISKGGRSGPSVRIPGTRAAFVLAAMSMTLLLVAGINALVT